MPKFNYQRFRDRTVNRLLNRYGASFAYTAVKKAAYDPATRTQVDNSATITVQGVVLGPMHQFIDQSVIKVADAKFLLDPTGLTEAPPKQGDRIAVNNIVYYVQEARQIRPSGDTTVLWILGLKAGT